METSSAFPPTILEPDVKRKMLMYYRMGNLMSKLCKIITHPIKEYRRKKTMKIYKEIVQNSHEEDIMQQDNIYFD